ncbi:trypsin-like serine protease [Streptomyces sp. NPDC057638]|uniref:trypsin-like serine protease n=1 Tax=Streptomyces sp. NPDC057638 TaxID=3346190 RepID=UPI003698AE92
MSAQRSHQTSGIRSRAALTSGALAALLLGGALTATPAAAVAGPPAPAGTHTFMAKIDIGEGSGARRCSGALVAPEWIATSSACFAKDPAKDITVPAGKPAIAAQALVGRTDLGATNGQTEDIVELVPRTDRDLVLARLARPIAGVAPVKVATAAPTAGETLTMAGFGRTQNLWLAGRLHTTSFAVNSVEVGTMSLTGAAPTSAVCKGDGGGPALRGSGAGAGAELVAVTSRTSMAGCLQEAPGPGAAISSRTDDLAEWIATVTGAARIADFNCDGVRDVAVGDPEAVVGGDAKAGVVRVVYGGGKGHAEIAQDQGTVPGGSEAGDRYGETLATVDHDLDGCTDLVVGVPAEDMGTQVDAGSVHVLFGAPAGLAKGRAAIVLEQGNGTGALGASGAEAGDRMGHALAAGTTTAGDPYVLIGAPGEDLDGVVNAGTAFYLRGSVNTSINQNKAGVSGTMEKDDRFGTSVAGSPNHIAVGTPTEAIGSATSAGGFELLSHKITAGFPTPLGGHDQGNDIINGGAETGDRFAASMAMIPYRPVGTASATESILAVGSPGEMNGTIKESGRVVTLRVAADGTVTQLQDIHQDAADVSGANEAGDRFGEKLSAVATTPRAVSTARNSLLAVGIPGEDIGTAVDSGSVWYFPLIGSAGAGDLSVEPGQRGLPGTPGAGERNGSSITATGTHLYLGMPAGPAATGAAHTVPWANILSGGTEPVTTLQPGTGGLPAAGAAFGTAIQ